MVDRKQSRWQKALDSIPQISQIQVDQGGQKVKIENHVGYIAVPVGLAGPLTITGDHQKSTVYAPLATTEATLVASCSRGCKAFEASGGIKALALREGMSRAPAFRFANTSDAISFYRRIPAWTSKMREIAESTSLHAKLYKLTPHVIGTDCHVKFVFATGDASGQNMTTIATHKACMHILETQGKSHRIRGFQIEGQLSHDKKIALRNDNDPRGVEVLAWGSVSNETSKRILGVSTRAIQAAWDVGFRGAARGAMLGSSINPSNIIAALFIACGQDAASIGESCWAQTSFDYDPETGDLNVSLYLPSLPVGTVGGGTVYGTQKEALKLLGCFGQGRRLALAETVCAFALALDLSTLAAVSNDTFTQSHAQLARGAKL